MTREKEIFKIACLTHNNKLYAQLNDDEGIFGLDFSKSFTPTRGAAFAFSHFNVGDQILTAQFWLLPMEEQWASVRNLYFKGSTGLIMLFDPKDKQNIETSNRMLTEFVAQKKFEVPMLIMSKGKTEAQLKPAHKFAKHIQNWAGTVVPVVAFEKGMTDENWEIFTDFMSRVRDWSAKNIVFQTLSVYFSMDSIRNKERSIDVILRQLRKIYTARYYSLLDDTSLRRIIYLAVKRNGFQLDTKKDSIIYKRELQDEPFSLRVDEDFTQGNVAKPRVEKLD